MLDTNGDRQRNHVEDTEAWREEQKVEAMCGQEHSRASGHQVSYLSVPPEVGLRPWMVCNPDTKAERVTWT